MHCNICNDLGMANALDFCSCRHGVKLRHYSLTHPLVLSSLRRPHSEFKLCLKNMPFLEVNPIARGMAVSHHFDNSVEYKGGPPRCPICLKSNQVRFNGKALLYKHKAAYGFHCNRCRVWWRDIAIALCFICEREFLADPSWRNPQFPDYVSNKDNLSCYHLNAIQHPFCERCESIVGDDRVSNRRRLRDKVKHA